MTVEVLFGCGEVGSKIVNCRFFNNACASAGPDVGGAAIRVFSQYNNLPYMW